MQALVNLTRDQATAPTQQPSFTFPATSYKQQQQQMAGSSGGESAEVVHPFLRATTQYERDLLTTIGDMQTFQNLIREKLQPARPIESQSNKLSLVMQSLFDKPYLDALLSAYRAGGTQTTPHTTAMLAYGLYQSLANELARQIGHDDDIRARYGTQIADVTLNLYKLARQDDVIAQHINAQTTEPGGLSDQVVFRWFIPPEAGGGNLTNADKDIITQWKNLVTHPLFDQPKVVVQAEADEEEKVPQQQQQNLIQLLQSATPAMDISGGGGGSSGDEDDKFTTLSDPEDIEMLAQATGEQRERLMQEQHEQADNQATMAVAMDNVPVIQQVQQQQQPPPALAAIQVPPVQQYEEVKQQAQVLQEAGADIGNLYLQQLQPLVNTIKDAQRQIIDKYITLRNVAAEVDPTKQIMPSEQSALKFAGDTFDSTQAVRYVQEGQKILDDIRKASITETTQVSRMASIVSDLKQLLAEYRSSKNKQDELIASIEQLPRGNLHRQMDESVDAYATRLLEEANAIRGTTMAMRDATDTLRAPIQLLGLQVRDLEQARASNETTAAKLRGLFKAAVDLVNDAKQVAEKTKATVPTFNVPEALSSDLMIDEGDIEGQLKHAIDTGSIEFIDKRVYAARQVLTQAQQATANHELKLGADIQKLQHDLQDFRTKYDSVAPMLQEVKKLKQKVEAKVEDVRQRTAPEYYTAQEYTRQLAHDVDVGIRDPNALPQHLRAPPVQEAAQQVAASQAFADKMVRHFTGAADIGEFATEVQQTRQILEKVLQNAVNVNTRLGVEVEGLKQTKILTKQKLDQLNVERQKADVLTKQLEIIHASNDAATQQLQELQQVNAAMEAGHYDDVDRILHQQQNATRDQIKAMEDIRGTVLRQLHNNAQQSPYLPEEAQFLKQWLQLTPNELATGQEEAQPQQSHLTKYQNELFQTYVKPLMITQHIVERGGAGGGEIPNSGLFLEHAKQMQDFTKQAIAAYNTNMGALVHLPLKRRELQQIGGGGGNKDAIDAINEQMLSHQNALVPLKDLMLRNTENAETLDRIDRQLYLNAKLTMGAEGVKQMFENDAHAHSVYRQYEDILSMYKHMVDQLRATNWNKGSTYWANSQSRPSTLLSTAQNIVKALDKIHGELSTVTDEDTKAKLAHDLQEASIRAGQDMVTKLWNDASMQHAPQDVKDKFMQTFVNERAGPLVDMGELLLNIAAINAKPTSIDSIVGGGGSGVIMDNEAALPLRKLKRIFHENDLSQVINDQVLEQYAKDYVRSLNTNTQGHLVKQTLKLFGDSLPRDIRDFMLREQEETLARALIQPTTQVQRDEQLRGLTQRFSRDQQARHGFRQEFFQHQQSPERREEEKIQQQQQQQQPITTTNTLSQFQQQQQQRQQQQQQQQQQPPPPQQQQSAFASRFKSLPSAMVNNTYDYYIGSHTLFPNSLYYSGTPQYADLYKAEHQPRFAVAGGAAAGNALFNRFPVRVGLATIREEIAQIPRDRLKLAREEIDTKIQQHRQEGEQKSAQLRELQQASFMYPQPALAKKEIATTSNLLRTQILRDLLPAPQRSQFADVLTAADDDLEKNPSLALRYGILLNTHGAEILGIFNAAVEQDIDNERPVSQQTLRHLEALHKIVEREQTRIAHARQQQDQTLQAMLSGDEITALRQLDDTALRGMSRNLQGLEEHALHYNQLLEDNNLQKLREAAAEIDNRLLKEHGYKEHEKAVENIDKGFREFAERSLQQMQLPFSRDQLMTALMGIPGNQSAAAAAQQQRQQSMQQQQRQVAAMAALAQQQQQQTQGGGGGVAQATTTADGDEGTSARTVAMKLREAAMQLRSITTDDVNFLEHVYYDSQRKRVRYRDTATQQYRDLTLEEQLRATRLFIRIIVAVYVLYLHKVSQADAPNVVATLERKYANEEKARADPAIFSQRQVALMKSLFRLHEYIERKLSRTKSKAQGKARQAATTTTTTNNVNDSQDQVKD